MRNKRFAFVLSVALAVAGIFVLCDKDTAYAATYFSSSGVTAPSSVMLQGRSFSMRGTIKSVTSSAKIARITAGVTNSSGAWVTGKYAYIRPMTLSYDLRNVDSRVKFGTLPVGSYHYKVVAVTSTGHSQIIINRSFRVCYMYVTSYSYPTDRYYGASFMLKGTVLSAKPLKTVTVGVTDSAGKFISGLYVNRTLASTSFGIGTVDTYIKFGKVPAGTHYYKVYAKDAYGHASTLINRRFTVSKFSVSSAVYPSSITAGRSYSIGGKVTSTYNISYIRAGVQRSGAWVSGANKYARPNTRTYDLAQLDSSIKFGTLAAGTYTYRVYVIDARGIKKYVLSKTFTVSSASSGTTSGTYVPVVSSGKRLSYSSTLLGKIGRQPYSGPCGGYAMAYGRMVIDRTFVYPTSYSSPQDYILRYYCNGQCLAYWGRASASSTYSTSTKYANRQVLDQINRGKPAIIAVCTSTSSNHYLTVIGYVGGTTYDNVTIDSFIVLDPVTASMRYIRDTNYLDKTERGMTPQFITFDN